MLCVVWLYGNISNKTSIGTEPEGTHLLDVPYVVILIHGIIETQKNLRYNHSYYAGLAQLLERFLAMEEARS